MHSITPVVKNLLIINVLLYAVVVFNLVPFIPNFENYFTLMPYKSGYFGFYQIITSMFMHGSPQHLLFNMLGLYFIGPMVEHTLGSQRFLFLYISAGIASALLHLGLSPAPALGASGAIYGVLAAFATMFPNMKMMVFPIPFEVKAMYLVGGYILYDLYSGVAGRATGIAHFAHVGGAVAGIIMIFMWRQNKLY
jgi:membrane associated rhomboid family serine protease